MNHDYKVVTRYRTPYFQVYSTNSKYISTFVWFRSLAIQMEINNVDSLVNRSYDQKLSPFPLHDPPPHPLRCQLLTNCPCYTNNILFISGTSFILLLLGLWPFQTLTRTLSVLGIRSSFIITVSVLSQRLFIQYVVYPSNI